MRQFFQAPTTYVLFDWKYFFITLVSNLEVWTYFLPLKCSVFMDSKEDSGIGMIFKTNFAYSKSLHAMDGMYWYYLWSYLWLVDYFYCK